MKKNIGSFYSGNARIKITYIFHKSSMTSCPFCNVTIVLNKPIGIQLYGHFPTDEYLILKV